MRQSERVGLREVRRAAFEQASGKTVDLGAGTGANLGLFPEAVSDLYLVEPDPHMLKRLEPKLEASGQRAELVAAGAEELPFDDDSIDTVVCALALCTIPDPERALREVTRVLRPGGRFLFVEHVRADTPRLAGWQDRMAGGWHFFCDGCYCNRDTVATIEASPLRLDRVETGTMPRVPSLVKPLAVGSATCTG